MARIRVIHPGDHGYSEYDVEAVEFSDPMVMHPVYFGTLILIDPTIPAERQEELKEGLPK